MYARTIIVLHLLCFVYSQENDSVHIPLDTNEADDIHWEEVEEIKEMEKQWLHLLDMTSIPTQPAPPIPEYIQVLYDQFEKNNINDNSIPTIIAISATGVRILDNHLHTEFVLSEKIFKHEKEISKAEIMVPRLADKTAQEVHVDLEICNERKRCQFARHVHKRHYLGLKSRWDVFDVTEILLKWMSHLKHGSACIFNLTIRRHRRSQAIAGFYDIGGSPHQDIVLIVYENLPNSFSLPAYPTRKKKRSVADEIPRAPPSRETGCQLHQWSISVADLGWDGWMLQPETLTPNICVGSCVVPASSHVNKTNHAFVRQTFLSKAKSENLLPPVPPLPMCTPLRFENLMVVYYEGKDVMAKSLPEMIATKCGCL